MSTGDDSTVVTTQPTAEPKRRVSIITDPVMDKVMESRLGHDNFAYEPSSRRKISSISQHSNLSEGRRSNLHSVNLDNTSVHSYGEKEKSNGDAGVKPKFTPPPPLIQLPKDDGFESSWVYSLCMRCRVEYNTPSWEPPHWQKVCPYPLCPPYRQFARIISLILIGVLIWVTAFVIIGPSAAPGGQLFNLVWLTVAANFGGFLMSLTTLPRLIGMLMVGILFQNIGWVHLDGDFSFVTAQLRKFALVIILTRAGLEMDPNAFKKVYVTILKLGLIPWTVECVVIGLSTHYLLDLPWMWAFLLGSIIAAVSPAVVVPCLFRLRTKGYGVAKGIPTLIIAVAGIDDATSVAVFGIIASLMFSSGSLAFQISQAPVCVFGGLGFGVFWGTMLRFIPERGDNYVVPLRTLLLFTGGLLAVFGSEKVHFEGAGPLGVVFAAFTASYFWCKQEDWDLEDNPVSTAFEIFWMIFEPILFGITGATVKFRELDPHVVAIGVGCIFLACILRILATVAIAFGDRLNTKEKVFVALSWMAKATVQAALGPIALRNLGPDATPEEKHYGEVVLMICVLSIVCTAPLGAILITLTGTRLLNKTKQPQLTDGWRRTHRPSLHDISVIDEEEEREDLEGIDDENTSANTRANARRQSYSIPR